MNAVFADTFYWIALSDFTDSLHERALALTRQYAASQIITERRPDIEVCAQSAASFAAGLALYRARVDKGYSLTDCISMQAMRRIGLTEILTNDRHFEQEGFRALFRI